MHTDEFEKQELPVVPPPVESESEFHYEPIEDPDKFKRKVRILLILVGICVLIGVLYFVNNTFNFYDLHMKKLRFDYREGESAKAAISDLSGEFAQKLTKQISQPSVHIQADQVVFSLDGTLLNQLTSYDYTYTNELEELHFRTGVEDWIFTESGTLRYTESGVKRKDGSEWKAESKEPMPDLYDYCFASADHGEIKIAFNNAYETEVSSEPYRCEIWLMESPRSGVTFYYTLYRYYQPDGQLAAVRVLRNNQQLMFVYDIKDYTLQ